MIAITGLPRNSSRWNPICFVRERCPKLRRSSGAYQRALLNSSGFRREEVVIKKNQLGGFAKIFDLNLM